MVYTIDNPKGIDKQIAVMQSKLFTLLGWNETNIYGRVYRNESKKNGIVPEVYLGRNEYLDVFLNDKVNATISFIDNETHTSLLGDVFQVDLKVVFCVNLSKLKPSLLHRADMEVEIEALKALRNFKMFEIEEIEKGIDNVFSGFNTDNVKLNDMQPFHVFSINGKLKYKINC